MRKITTSEQKNIIGSRIRQLRMARKLTQDELAARLQVNGYNFSKLTILRIELGKRLVTDIELKGLCEFFETDPNSLLGYRPDSPKEEALKDPFIRRFELYISAHKVIFIHLYTISCINHALYFSLMFFITVGYNNTKHENDSTTGGRSR